MPSPIERLPLEIILEIVNRFEWFETKQSFSQTCRAFHVLLLPDIFKLYTIKFPVPLGLIPTRRTHGPAIDQVRELVEKQVEKHAVYEKRKDFVRKLRIVLNDPLDWCPDQVLVQRISPFTKIRSIDIRGRLGLTWSTLAGLTAGVLTSCPNLETYLVYAPRDHGPTSNNLELIRSTIQEKGIVANLREAKFKVSRTPQEIYGSPQFRRFIDFLCNLSPFLELRIDRDDNGTNDIPDGLPDDDNMEKELLPTSQAPLVKKLFLYLDSAAPFEPFLWLSSSSVASITELDCCYSFYRLGSRFVDEFTRNLKYFGRLQTISLHNTSVMPDDYEWPASDEEEEEETHESNRQKWVKNVHLLRSCAPSLRSVKIYDEDTDLFELSFEYQISVPEQGDGEADVILVVPERLQNTQTNPEASDEN